MLANNDAVTAQIERINKDFNETGISFFLSSLSYHMGREWTDFAHHRYDTATPQWDAYAERIKAENRYGGNDELNIWVVEKIDDVDCKTGVATRGYCTYARNLLKASHSVDGCVIDIESLPNVTFRFPDMTGDGTVMTHEIGHWLDLPHIFPDGDGVGCTGESDGIEDTYQFPNDISYMFNGVQPRCCLTGETWDYCSDDSVFNVTNYMSYSSQKGVALPGNDPHSMPWTTGQRAKMFSTYFLTRRTRTSWGGVTCNDYPVIYDGRHTRRFEEMFDKRNNDDLIITGDHILDAGPKLMDTLREICAKAPDPDSTIAIDTLTGEAVKCDKDGNNCGEPSGGNRCPDGSALPCKYGDPAPGEKCIGGMAPPCPNTGSNTCPGQSGNSTDVGLALCPSDTGTLVCPGGKMPQCWPDDTGKLDPGSGDGTTTDPGDDRTKTDPGDDGTKTDPGDDGTKTDPGDDGTTYPGDDGTKTDPGGDGTKTDPGGDGTKTNPGDDGTKTDPGGDGTKTNPGDDGTKTDPGGDGTTTYPGGDGTNTGDYPSACPAACNVHSNACDKTTAPTCIFPDPRVSKPRGACACRPGYKASGYKDTDVTKQWRLPIPGQEHRVWVAEGVPCDKLCTVSTGVDSCREVKEISSKCAGT